MKKISHFYTWMLILAAGFPASAFAGASVSCLDHDFAVEGDQLQLELLQKPGGAFEGTVLIVGANGEITLVDSQEQVPADLNGTTIEVFEGSIALTGQAGLTLSCMAEKGSAMVDKGTVAVTGCRGEKMKLEAGRDYPFGPCGMDKETLPPTEASEDNPGFPAEDLRTPDSRNIEQSPS